MLEEGSRISDFRSALSSPGTMVSWSHLLQFRNELQTLAPQQSNMEEKCTLTSSKLLKDPRMDVLISLHQESSLESSDGSMTLFPHQPQLPIWAKYHMRVKL